MRGLRARAEEAVQHVAAHMAVLGQRVGAGHHEQRAVQHDLRVERPGVRLVQHVAREHLPARSCSVRRDDRPRRRAARARWRGGRPPEAVSACCCLAKKRAAVQQAAPVRRKRPFRPSSVRLAEEAVVRHLEVDHVVVLPLPGALGERLLRIEHLLEQRVLRGLLGDDLVPGVELRLQDRVGRLVELDLVLGLAARCSPWSCGRSPSSSCRRWRPARRCR